MSDIDLAVAFNRIIRVEFTRGEDRDYNMLVRDESEGLPIDLTGAALTVSFPRDGGGSVKRRTSPLLMSFANAQTLNGLTLFSAAGHGLVTGDVITLNAAPSNTLPSPYEDGQRYIVSVEDVNMFGLLDLNGVALKFKGPSGTVALLSSDDFTFGNLAIGQAHLKLSAVFTAAVTIGQGLSYQVTYRDPTGLVRIYSASNQLDVWPQPCP